MKGNNLFLALVAMLFTFPATGFVYGMIACTDCGYNIFGRVFIGLIHAIFILFGGGTVLKNEGGGDSVNLRIYLIPAFILIFALLKAISYFRSRKSAESIVQN